jgi:hypothetical protein
MQSPEAFVAGLGKGTGGLMRGVVSGAITSTAAIGISKYYSYMYIRVYVCILIYVYTVYTYL